MTEEVSYQSKILQKPGLSWFFVQWILLNAVAYALAFSIATIWGTGVLLFGAIIGLFQWILLRRFVSDAGCWGVSGCAGWVVSIFVSMLIVVLINGISLFEAPSSLTKEMAVQFFVLSSTGSGAIAGVLQWLVVSDEYKYSGWWIAGSVFGWLIPFAIISAGILLSPSVPNQPLITPGIVVVNLSVGSILGAISGLFTAVPLVAMLRHPMPPKQPNEVQPPPPAKSTEPTSEAWGQIVNSIRGEPDPDRPKFARRRPGLPLYRLTRTATQLTDLRALWNLEEHDEQAKRALLNLYDDILPRLDIGGPEENRGCMDTILRRPPRIVVIDPNEHIIARSVLRLWYTEKLNELSDVSDIEKNNKAIQLVTEAIDLLTPDQKPEYPYAQTLLGDNYLRRFIGNREESLAKAVQCYEAALQLYTPEYSELDHADCLLAVGTTYALWPSGSKKQNIERALSYYQKAVSAQ